MRAGLFLLVILVGVISSGPLFGQIDLSGEWSNLTHEDVNHRQSVEIGDYAGLPLTEAGRFKAESWDEAVLATHERQCIPHVVTYAMRGQPGNMRISKLDDPDTGQILAYTIHGTYGRPRTIWMDGRAHPSEYAPHTWSGFSTGRWEGSTLVVTTTHIKMGWIMRNGVPTSDRATMTERFIRHGEHLLDVIIVHDPIYLSEPFIRTQDWVLNLRGEPNAWGACGPAQIADEIPNQKAGYVPHHLPGANDMLREFPAKRHVPTEAARGGAETMYPEYILKMQGRTGPMGQKPAPLAIPPSSVPKPGDIEVLHVQGDVYMLAGAGGNIAIQVGEDGIVVVDSGASQSSDKVLAAILKLSGKPIRFVLNTGADLDHIGGNELLARNGTKLGGGLLVGGTAGDGAAIIAHEQVLRTVSAPTGKTAPTLSGSWPTDAYPGESKEVYANGEGVEMLHQPGHTGGDSIVYFRRSDVVVAGDLYSTLAYPVIDTAHGGTFKGLLAALNRIIEITIPKDWQEGGTMVIPGHGRLADEADVVEYRDMITIIGDRIRDMARKGMTLEQVKAARPTRDYDGRYGSPDLLIEAAYREVK